MLNDTVLNNRYRLIAQQGSGGMAVIFKATDLLLGRTVAVKTLRPSLTEDPAFIARFRNEARSVANLAHPSIVTVHDVGSHDEKTHYIVMEFVDGQDLKRIIRAEGKLPVERVLRLGTQICAGIGYAHRSKLVHADVKPQNILVTNQDIVKVTDFGIAQALTDARPGERQNVVWGSPHYFAPEQAKGERPTTASDVYSIGIMLFEMLSGRLPYTGQNQQELALAHIRDRIPMVTEFEPDVPEPLSRIIYKMMSKEPDNRYRMADQVGGLLEKIQTRTPSISLPPSPSPNQVTQAGMPPVSQPVASPAQQSPLPSPPPMPQPQPQQPMYRPTPADPYPTQRYDLAPNAPYTSAPQTMISQPAPPSGFQNSNQQGYLSQSQPIGTNSGVYYSQPLRDNHELPSAFDGVTIALAVLAFFAVACLIPLYILVLQARFGG